jgi:hypothetical protein
MYIVKNIITFFLNVIENFKYKKIINREDLKIAINHQYKEDKALKKIYENGYVLIDNYFSSQDIDETRESLRFDKKKNNWSYATFVVQPKSLIDRILKDEKIKNLLVSYLGKDVKLDLIEANLYSSNPEKVSSSEKWHYDVVGKRIKIFLFLNDCESIFTQYIDGTNNILHGNYTSSGSRISDNTIKKKYNKKSKIFPKKGSLFIFDTNGLHKGVYRNNQVIEKKKDRYTIQMEFSSKSKSDKLVNLNCNSIGVRNIFFSKQCDLKDYLLDEDYVNEFLDENIIFYDQEYSSS